MPGIACAAGGSDGGDIDVILDGLGSMSTGSVGVMDDLSYDRRSLVLDGDDVSDAIVIGGCDICADAIGVSMVSISCAMESTEGNGEFLILRRLPSSSIWLILVGKR